ncbi:MAG: alpha-galactosidase [Anaerolineales bacterium]|jgi:alpha-galactosidase
MIHTLENGSLQLKIDTALSRWSVTNRQRQGPSIEGAQVNISYRRGRAHRQALNQWKSPSVSEPETLTSVNGSLRQISLKIEPQKDDLVYRLNFALLEEQPVLLWKLAIDNQGRGPVFVDDIDLLSAGFIFQSRPGLRGKIFLTPHPEHDREPIGPLREPRARKIEPMGLPGDYAFYSNGWQSWSYAGVYGPLEQFRRTRLGFLRAPVIFNHGTPQPKRAGVFASDMFGVLGDRDYRTALLLGFLSQRQHFGSLETWIGSSPPAIRLWANGDGARLDPGQQIETDWACLYFFHLDTHDPLAPYLEAVGREHGLNADFAPPDQIPTGWCSWYHFFREVKAEDIRANLKALGARRPDLPVKIVQIDDGYESRVGDWSDFRPGFPRGVAPLAAEIRQEGFTPGLWLAPFLVHPRSRLANDHPDWLLRGRWGRPANAGRLWDAFHTALDLTNPDALAYVSDLVHTAANEWGFPFLKLDFLYAGALPGRFKDPRRTRAQALRQGLEAVRSAAGERTYLLGCGCPLGPAIGLVDAMRIGPDVDHHWEPPFKGVMRFFKNEPDIPSARNAIHNSLTRAHLQQRWWINDPDCLLLRSGTTRQGKPALTLAEIQSLATVVAMSGGLMLLSDHLPELPPERLRIAEVMLPVIGQRPHVLDWFDSPTPSRLQIDLHAAIGSWHLLALFNWEDKPQDLAIRAEDFYLDPQVAYIAREFWSGRVVRIPAQGDASEAAVLLEGVPAHGVVLLAAQPFRAYHPLYLGSDLHISQGLEVKRWKWESGSSSGKSGRLSLQLERPGKARGRIEVWLPGEPREARLGGRPVEWQALGEGRYRFEVEFEGNADIQIEL